MEIMKNVKVVMAIKAHNDTIRMGNILLNDLSITEEMKDLIRQEMKNSHLCIDTFGLSGKGKECEEK